MSDESLVLEVALEISIYTRGVCHANDLKKCLKICLVRNKGSCQSLLELLLLIFYFKQKIYIYIYIFSNFFMVVVSLIVK